MLHHLIFLVLCMLHSITWKSFNLWTRRKSPPISLLRGAAQPPPWHIIIITIFLLSSCFNDVFTSSLSSTSIIFAMLLSVITWLVSHLQPSLRQLHPPSLQSWSLVVSFIYLEVYWHLFETKFSMHLVSKLVLFQASVNTWSCEEDFFITSDALRDSLSLMNKFLTFE